MASSASLVTPWKFEISFTYVTQILYRTSMFWTLYFRRNFTNFPCPQLDVVGPGGPPDGHGDGDDGGHHH